VSAVYALVESGVVVKLAPPADPASLNDTPLRTRRSQDPDRKARGWEISEDLIRQMREFCESRNVRLLVVGIPTMERVMEDDRAAAQILAAAESAGAPVLALLDPFRASTSTFRETLYYPKDRHWTPAGHDLAAEYVAAALLEGGFLRPR
jgi:hypothetical protein